MAVKKATQGKVTELSHDAKTIITVIVLLLAYPIGLILMWSWVSWPRWLRILISLPVLLFLAIFF